MNTDLARLQFATTSISTKASYDLTIASTASGHYALTVMTVAAAVLTPIVLVYQGWTYRVFRGRVSAPAAGPDG